MTAITNSRKVKAGITAGGFVTAVKDYTEPAVVEELCANSFDADANTILVLLDERKQQLHIIDDGTGFTYQSIETVALLGGGDKRDAEYSSTHRPYLGAYGFGLKSTVRIARKVNIHSISSRGEYEIDLDWTRLEDALRSDGEGYELTEKPVKKKSKTGTHITLDLKNPTVDQLDDFHRVLGNLPTDGGKCKYYTGKFSNVTQYIKPALSDFGKLGLITRDLSKRRLVRYVSPSDDPDLKDCQVFENTDKQDPEIVCKIYFAGMDGDKVRPLKKGLRGIYVRIQGRLLKQSFDDQQYVYGISKWVKFASGLRVELTIDWLRNEISLSRDGLTFSTPKLKELFRAALVRNISAFIGPQLRVLEKKAQKHTSKKQQQRLELATARIQGQNSRRIQSVSGSFNFRPETDSELALIVANDGVMKKINPSYCLIDYNDKEPFDCIIYDSSQRGFVFCELEPTIMEFLQHKRIPEELKLIIVWSIGKWRIGARKKGLKYSFELLAGTSKKRGCYRMMLYKQFNAKKPMNDIEVVALDELLKNG